ncbi:MmgE/PrpD family protein [Verticiella sediminum]|nr:MmgE/PrpD family protein [Verticiella sediminum]
MIVRPSGRHWSSLEYSGFKDNAGPRPMATSFRFRKVQKEGDIVLTQRLAEFVIDTRVAALPAQALPAARAAFIDTVGCALLGLTEPVSELAARWAEENGARGRVAVWGRTLSTSPAEAAFANAIASHALDFDDAMPTLRGHPSTTLVPAILAAGADAGASGEHALASYVLGLEVAGKLGVAVGDGHYFRGWHTTATVGVMSSTAAVARLWRLDPDQLRTAWGLAATQASGLVRNFGSMAKPFHAGHAARSALLSVWLARNGCTAERSIFDVPGGFLSTYAGEGATPLAECIERLGAPWEIAEPGIYVKRWPCCYANHRAVGGLLQLKEEHGLRADEIESIDIGFLPGGDGALISSNPHTGLEAKFSIEYCAAAAFIDGTLTMNSFTDDQVMRKPVRALMKKVRRHRIEDSKVYSGLKGYTDVTVRTSRGRYRMRVDKTPGSPAWPLTDADRKEKFLDGARRALGDPAAGALFDQLSRLGSADDGGGRIARDLALRR